MVNTLPQSLAIAGIVGVLSGTHTAIWGMYKDAAHEGFGIRRFLRSVTVGLLAAIMLQATLQLDLSSVSAVVVLFGLAYATERGIVEVWKTFVREEDQSKYFIPMQFSVGGRPVTGRGARLAVGAAYVTAVTACLLGIARLDHAGGPLSPAARAVLAGLTVGTVVALGGCWKDAPKEGFDLVKFWRSPLLTIGYAVLLSPLAESYLQMAVAAIGYERATAETWKTFFFPSKPRGKFTGKPILHPDMLEQRRYFVPAYIVISAGVIVGLTMAIGR